MLFYPIFRISSEISIIFLFCFLVDGEGGVVTEGGVNVGVPPSYVTYLEDSADHSSIYAAAAAAAANGHTMYL